MPGFDGTGPRGEGSMTGGGRGRCNPALVRDAAQQGRVLYGVGRGGIPWGGGRGRCFGGGRGNERQVLFEQITALEQELEKVRERLREIKSEKDEAK